MQTPLYANDGDTSPTNLVNPSLSAENRLYLLPEHLAQVGSAFVKQLSLTRFRSRDVRILSAIY